MRERLTWEQTWLGVAKTIALRSSCSLFQAGAVIVDCNERIIATGYNGPPRESELECQDDCPRAQEGSVRGSGYGFGCISIHAEANALLFVDRSAIEGGTMYVNGVSCEDCAKLIANSGIKRVVFVDDRKIHRPASPIMHYWLLHGITSGRVFPDAE